MSNNTENLVLEHLKHIRRTVDVIQNDVRDLKFRIGQVEETLMHYTRRMDSIDDRLSRLESRLDLVEA